MTFADWIAAGRVSVLLLVAFGALFGLIWSGVMHLIKRNKVKNHPLDISLREKVASTLTWEDCALYPEFCEAVLTHYHFLVEDYGFSLPRIEAGANIMKYRRAETGIFIYETYTEHGQEVLASIVTYRTAGSSVVVAEKVIGSKRDDLGDGHRGVAFYLKSNLNQFVKNVT